MGDVQKISVALHDGNLQKYDDKLAPFFFDQCVCGNLNAAFDVIGEQALCPNSGCRRPLRTNIVVAYLQSYKKAKVALEYVDETGRPVIIAHQGCKQCGMIDLGAFERLVLASQNCRLEDVEKTPISSFHAPIAAKYGPMVVTVNAQPRCALIDLKTLYYTVLNGDQP